MSSLRRIVPDNSVILPAFFNERIEIDGTTIYLTEKAQRLRTAILLREVEAFAPESLIEEFVKTAGAKEEQGVPYEDISLAIKQFLELPIHFQSGKDLAEKALDLVREQGIEPADSWYVACAIYYEAEFWLSHRHSDGLAVRAASIHRGNVFTLQECSFDKPDSTKPI